MASEDEELKVILAFLYLFFSNFQYTSSVDARVSSLEAWLVPLGIFGYVGTASSINHQTVVSGCCVVYQALSPRGIHSMDVDTTPPMSRGIEALCKDENQSMITSPDGDSLWSRWLTIRQKSTDPEADASCGADIITVRRRKTPAPIFPVPMYSEAKLAFYIYLWYPKTKGTTYVYDSFFRPYVAKHESDIDRSLLELRTRAGDMAVVYWQRAASYGQTRVFDILQYIAAQSTPRPRAAQPQQQGARGRQPPAPSRQPSTNRQPAPTPAETEEPPSPTSSTSSSQHQTEVAEETDPSKVLEAAVPATASNPPKANGAASEVSSQPQPTEEEAMETEEAPSSSANENAPSSSANENENNTPKETVMEQTMRLTRGRLRKTRSVTKS
ncbi:unnamed protein product [Dovyalis caffra]|uniref:HVA22-like protein n=1 Tax=Dovyalis caffra TaxID=77055 RepID=A0AAV1S7M0_9ROSI|nr:unnamed protein product [Dovyalis caffra]